MTGQVIRHYEVGEKLGSGGMGVVYRARDTKLERDVALKFLPPEWSRDEDAKQRFMQEARAASGLDHENICTIYDIGETDEGQMFIVMPFYRGQTLKYRLKRGRLSPSEAIVLTRQLLNGLARAHEAGIIHRDIKPANVMVTDRGQVKLLDFGIAKLGAGLGLTQTGSTLGTAAYMSPEQAKGGGVDQRSDIWAVGVVFYEMLTGRRPFEGDYEQAVIYAILNTEPRRPSTLDPAIPQRFSESAFKMLAKNPDDRPANAHAAIRMLESADSGLTEEKAIRRSGPLRWIALPLGLLTVAVLAVLLLKDDDRLSSSGLNAASPAVAVLPFSNLRSDPETDFLGYALADQIISSLAYASNLIVRPSTSIRQYEDRIVDAGTVGNELSVDYVLAGNYLKERDQMRLTVEMVDAGTNEMIWREPIEVEYKNTFQLQDLVSEKVLRRLEVTFSSQERGRMQGGVPGDPLAYEYYLRALAYPETHEGNRLAVEMVERSIELDSTFAPAWNQLGFRVQRLAQYSLRGEEAIQRSIEAFERALELNPELLDALGNLSNNLTDLGRTNEAYELANRMLDINPHSALGHFARGYALRYSGMLSESVEAMETAIRLDSTDARFRSAGITFFQAQDYERAMRAFEIDSGSPYAESWQAAALLRLGDTLTAYPILERVAEEDPEGLIGAWATGLKAPLDGEYSGGVAAARRWEAADVADAESWYYLATAYCINRALDRCLELLARSVERGYFNFPGMQQDLFLDNARSDPRFERILEKARTKHEAFKARYFPELQTFPIPE